MTRARGLDRRHGCSSNAKRLMLLSALKLFIYVHAFAPRGRLGIRSRGRNGAPLSVLIKTKSTWMPSSRKPPVFERTSQQKTNVAREVTKLKAPYIQNDEDPNADHRYSASDWWQNIKSLPHSTVLRTTRGPVLAVMVWSCFLSALNSGWLLGHSGAAQTLTCSIPSTLLHSATVSVLGLLLVFRTNSAYQKFNEGRHIWERILSISRRLTRMIYLYPEFTVERRERIFHALAAFPYLLHLHVQPNYIGPHNIITAPTIADPSSRRERLRSLVRGLPETFTTRKQPLRVSIRRAEDTCQLDRQKLPWSLFSDRAVELCSNSSNRPLWVCDRMGHEIHQVSYTDNYTNQERSKLLSCIDQLSTAVGECERIHRTAVPLNYARHSLRGLTLWLFTLPLSLIKDFGWFTAPVMGLAAWVLYGIYQIGYTIEDPFQGSLRLATLCDKIYHDVMCDERRVTAFEITTGEREEWKNLPL